MNTDSNLTDRSRRSFLQLLPLGVFAGVFASISGAAFRCLRPRLMAPSDQWLDVATLPELTGPQPIVKKVLADHVSGLLRSGVCRRTAGQFALLSGTPVSAVGFSCLA